MNSSVNHLKILRHEQIFVPREGYSCHASSLLPLKDGRTVCVWFGGSREGAADVRIWGSVRDEAGRWSDIRPLTPDDGLAHWNPVLLDRGKGEILLFYKRGMEISSWQTMVCCSRDGGQHFDAPQELVPGDRGGRGPVKNKILRLSNGWLAAPASVEQESWECFIDLSRDNGQSWQQGVRLSPGSKRNEGIIQPTLWEEKGDGREGRVHALFRSSFGQLFRSDSADYGVSWCPPYAAGLPNNNSGVDLAALPDGRLVLALNPVEGNWRERSPLSLYLSTDEGDSWELLSHLETAPGEYSYPAVVADGERLAVSYTWNRRTIAYWMLEIESAGL